MFDAPAPGDQPVAQLRYDPDDHYWRPYCADRHAAGTTTTRPRLQQPSGFVRANQWHPPGR